MPKRISSSFHKMYKITVLYLPDVEELIDSLKCDDSEKMQIESEGYLYESLDELRTEKGSCFRNFKLYPKDGLSFYPNFSFVSPSYSPFTFVSLDCNSEQQSVYLRADRVLERCEHPIAKYCNVKMGFLIMAISWIIKLLVFMFDENADMKDSSQIFMIVASLYCLGSICFDTCVFSNIRTGRDQAGRLLAKSEKHPEMAPQEGRATSQFTAYS